jgi:cell division septum initiation protein DivIVA
MSDHARLPSVAEAQRTPLVEQLLPQLEQLLEENRRQAEQIQQLRDEIAVLKGQKAKPRFKASGMDTKTEPGDDADGSDEADGDGGAKRKSRKRAGSSKRRQTQQLTIHSTLMVPPQVPVPVGSRFEGSDLKAYRHHPDPARVPALTARFDAIFTQRTAFTTLNRTLKRLHAHKEELLLVLKRPGIVLHTNGSEGDIRG